MSSPKGRLLGLLGGVLLREAEVAAVESLSPRFRRVHLVGHVLRDAGAEPGDKVQVLLPSADVRTYTPILYRDESLLVYLQDRSPAATWAGQLAPGDRLRFKGPDRSLTLPAGPIVLVGDETSIAVAAAYAAARPGGVATVLEARGVDLAPALGALGVVAVVVPAEPGGGHHARIAAAVVQAIGGRSGVTVGLTGGATLIQGVRAALGGQGALQGGRAIRVKTYWAEGRVGLD